MIKKNGVYKTLLFSVIVLLIIFSLPLVFSENKVTTTTEIEQALNTEEEVPIIIYFKDTPSSDIQSSSAQLSYDSNSKTVLNTLSTKDNDSDEYDFELDHQFPTLNGMSGTVTKEGLEKLEANPLVEDIYLDKEFKALLPDSVPMVNGTVVHSKQILNLNLTGTDQTVCIIDSGVNYLLPGLGGCFGTGCKVLDGFNYADNEVDVLDDNGHGTHVASIVASNDTTNPGVAPNANIVALKALNHSGTGPGANVIAAIDWCISNRTVYNITTIVMSLGDATPVGSYCNGALPNAANDAVANGIFVAVAAGNEASSTGISSPACAINVTSVSSVDDGSSSTTRDSVSSFSNTASILDIFAPGQWITANVPKEFYCTNGTGEICSDTNTQTVGGTSQAAPHVAGAAMLLYQYKLLENGTTLLPQQIEDALKNSSTFVTDPDNSLTFARLDILASLEYIDTQAPNLNVSEPRNITYNSSTSSVDFNFSSHDIFLDTTWYSLDGAANTTITTNTTLNITSGSHNLIVYSNDTSNNNINTTTINFGVEGITLLSPINNQNISSSNLTLSCHGTSSNTIDNITLFHNLSGSFIENETRATDNSSITASFSLNQTPDGNYSWNCRMTENNNTQTFASSNFSFTLDTAFPIIHDITLPRIYIQNHTNLTILVNATDNTTGIANVTIEDQLVNLSNNLWQGSIELTDDTLDVVVTDFANNVQSNNTFKYIIDDTAPNVTLTSPLNNAVNVSLTTNITITFSESLNTSLFTNESFLILDSQNRSISFTGNYTDNQTIFTPILRFEPDQTYRVNITSNVTDLASNSFDSFVFNFTTVLLDTDNDGVPDSADTDDDNDGLSDGSDFLLGNASNINSNAANISLIINGTTNASKLFNGSTELRFFTNSSELLDFSFSFSNSNNLSLSNVSLISQNSSMITGGMIIKGLEGISKTAYIDNVTDFHGICFRNDSISSFDDFSTNCTSASETFIACPGTTFGITCATNGTKLKVSGLTSSAVIQHNDTVTPSVTTISVAYTGNITATLSVTTSEASTCSLSKSDVTFTSMTNLNTTGGTSHTSTEDFSVTTSGTYYVRCRDPKNNTMLSSSSLAFTATVTTSSSPAGNDDSSTGGGGSTSTATTTTTTKANETSTEDTPTDDTTTDPNILDNPSKTKSNGDAPNERSFKLNYTTDDLKAVIELNPNLRLGLQKVLGKKFFSFVTKDTPKVLESLTSNKVLTHVNGSELTLSFSYNGSEPVKDFFVYDELPKTFAQNVSEVIITANDAKVTIIDPDPILMFSYKNIEPNSSYVIEYSTNKTIDISVLDETKAPYFFVKDENIPIISRNSYAILGIVLLIVIIFSLKSLFKKRSIKLHKKKHKPD